jgi:predicted N-acetyltransferase YhbS
MGVVIRRATEADSLVCGRILYTAFKTLAEQHRFPPDFHTEEDAIYIIRTLIAHPSIFGVVAEDGAGKIVGSNFLDERDCIYSVGPISVDPQIQGQGIGRRLMEAVLERGKGKNIRLLTDGFNMQSIPLYASLGFEVKEPVFLMAGRPHDASPEDIQVLPMTRHDLDACAMLSRRILGYERTNGVRDILQEKLCAPFVALRQGRVTAYLTSATFWSWNHGIAESEQEMQALLLGAAAATKEPLSLLVPGRQTDLFHWCLRQGLRVVKPITLMVIGAYQEPNGCYFPSIEY